jgi:5-methylcytosine-specific restriction enzyme A
MAPRHATRVHVVLARWRSAVRHAVPMTRRDDRRSPEAAAYRKLYKTAAWKHARATQLARQPLCELCLERGITRAATVVNHRQPHKGDMTLFLDPKNLQSVDSDCHDGPIQSYERTGRMRGCDADGVPLDKGHHWAT